jgi:hypothetical protein
MKTPWGAPTLCPADSQPEPGLTTGQGLAKLTAGQQEVGNTQSEFSILVTSNLPYGVGRPRGVDCGPWRSPINIRGPWTPWAP